jgi:hypothetical protein
MEVYRYFPMLLHGTLYSNRDGNCSVRLTMTRMVMTLMEYCGTLY